MDRYFTNAWQGERWTIKGQEGNIILPKVTIGILSHNRKDDLRRTLDSIIKSTEYPDFEVIVVDNFSSDGSIQMVKREFPSVEIISLNTNFGTSSRNQFYNSSSGKYIFSYDDDSFPATPATIYHAVVLLENNPHFDAVSFFCFQPLTGFSESGELPNFRFSGSVENGFEGLFFVEGGMCIRRQAWEKIQGYDPDFLWGAEGADLTLQMYQKDLKTIYYPGLANLHLKSSVNRNFSTNAYLFTRNYIWTIAKHFPFYAAIPLTFLYILRRFISIVLYPGLSKFYIKGIWEGITGFITQQKKADKLTLRQVFGLKRWYVFLYRW